MPNETWHLGYLAKILCVMNTYILVFLLLFDFLNSSFHFQRKCFSLRQIAFHCKVLALPSFGPLYTQLRQTIMHAHIHWTCTLELHHGSVVIIWVDTLTFLFVPWFSLKLGFGTSTSSGVNFLGLQHSFAEWSTGTPFVMFAGFISCNWCWDAFQFSNDLKQVYNWS